MEQALYRKWRPQLWDEVVGQEHVITTIRNAVKSERVAHAYLLAGPRGTGKTSTARLLAKAVNCLAPEPKDRPCNSCGPCQAVNEGRFLDLVEIDAASNTSVEDVRDLRDKINFAPNQGRFKVYIVDEVHMLSTAAFNALLKTLEEPPAHAIFILATTEVHKIPATVLSRCQRHEFRRLPVSTMIDFLKMQSEQEALKVGPEVLELIARQATGSLRDAISLFDQLTSTGQDVTLQMAEEVLGTATIESVRGLVRALISGDRAEGLSILGRTLDSGTDARQFARQIVDTLRLLMMVRMQVPRSGASDDPELRQAAEAIDDDLLLASIRAFSQAASETRSSWLPQLPLEMAFVGLLSDRREAQGLKSGGPSNSVKVPDNPSPKPVAVSTVEAPSPPAAEGEQPSSPRAEIPDEQPSQVNPPASEDASEVTHQAIHRRWKDVLEAAHRRDPLTQALLRSSKPLGLRGEVLVIGFPSDLLREKMEKGHNLAIVEQSLEEILGMKLDVRCVIQDQWTPTEVVEQAVPMADGGMVATATRDLGAQVVEVQPAAEEDDLQSG